MALTEETEIDKIEIVGPHRIIQIRTATVIKRDGEEISRSFHRRVITPNVDVTNENDEIKNLTSALWTNEIKTNYINYINS